MTLSNDASDTTTAAEVIQRRWRGMMEPQS